MEFGDSMLVVSCSLGMSTLVVSWRLGMRLTCQWLICSGSASTTIQSRGLVGMEEKLPGEKSTPASCNICDKMKVRG